MATFRLRFVLHASCSPQVGGTGDPRCHGGSQGRPERQHPRSHRGESRGAGPRPRLRPLTSRCHASRRCSSDSSLRARTWSGGTACSRASRRVPPSPYSPEARQRCSLTLRMLWRLATMVRTSTLQVSSHVNNLASVQQTQHVIPEGSHVISPASSSLSAACAAEHAAAVERVGLDRGRATAVQPVASAHCGRAAAASELRGIAAAPTSARSCSDSQRVFCRALSRGRCCAQPLRPRTYWPGEHAPPPARQQLSRSSGSDSISPGTYAFDAGGTKLAMSSGSGHVSSFDGLDGIAGSL